MPSKKRRISSGSGSPASPIDQIADARRIAQRARDRDDLLQVQRCEIVAGRRAAPLHEPREHAGVVDARVDVVDAPDARDVGHRLDVEDEQRRHRRCGRLGVQSMLRELPRRFNAQAATRNDARHAGNTPVDR